MVQKYSKPPITEAVIAIAVKAATDDEMLEKMTRRFADNYPPPVQRVHLATNVEIQITDRGIQVRQPPPGYKLVSADGTDVILLVPNQIITSRMAPYPGWEALVSRARENWDIWKRAAGWHEVARIGVRFTNRLDIPMRSQEPIDLDEYLTVSPRLAPIEGLSQPMDQFAVNARAPLGKDNCQLILNVGSIPSPLVATGSFLLDIDVSTETAPQNDDAIWSLISRIRDYKNEIFEMAITDKARELFA
jgi:uncharacterized protein (TIGR04255 family)